MNPVTTGIGYLAGALTMISYVPQVARVWRTRRVQDLSGSTFVLLVSSAAAWIAYGVRAGLWPVIVANAGVLALTGAVLVAKVRYGSAGVPTTGPDSGSPLAR